MRDVTGTAALGRARMAMVLAFGLGLGTGLVGCPKQALVLDSNWVRDHAGDEDLRDTLQQALEAHEQGDMKAALALLDAARSRTKDPEVLAFIGLREGMAHLRLGDPGAADEALGPVVSSGFESLASRAHVLMGLAFFAMGRHPEAESILGGTDLATARKVTEDTTLQAGILAAAGDLALSKSDWAGACLRFAWATLDLGSSTSALDEARALLEKLDSAIDKQATVSDPKPKSDELLAAVPSSGPFWALLARRAAHDALIAWDLARAEKLALELESAGFGALATPLMSAIESARNELDATDPMTIGAILPLTGKNASIGLMMKEGIETALRILNTEHEFNVVFLDTAGNTDVARKHVQDLKDKHHAIAVLGPAAGSTAQAAALKAETIGMPLIALSLKPGLTAKRHFVFRNFSTHESEAQLLARYAVQTAGLVRLGVIHPDSTYGRGMAKSFSEEVSALGGKVVLTQAFPPSELNFVEVAGKVSEKKDVQGLFVPATNQQLGLIAPALAYRDVWPAPLEDLATADPDKEARRLLLMAPQVAYSHDLPFKAGKYLQGTVFSAGFFAETTDPFATFFVQEFERDHKGRVTSYHAYAADSLFIVATAVALGGVRTRSQLPLWLSDPARCTTSTTTVAAFGGFDESGEAAGPLQLFRLSGDTFEALTQ